ncbi:MAG: hypothetical protein JW874_06270 [Spirochaetales bacterium]|nr:hypothetical protein [Spirochaetales bacterium]
MQCPSLGPPDQNTARSRLIDYNNTLDEIGIHTALYFKLVESGGPGVEHPNSFLIDSNPVINSRYDVMKNFGRTND